RAHALGDRLDRAALARTVAPLEHDADLETLLLHPFLQLHELFVELLHLLRVVLAGELAIRLPGTACGWLSFPFATALAHDPTPQEKNVAHAAWRRIGKYSNEPARRQSRTGQIACLDRSAWPTSIFLR